MTGFGREDLLTLPPCQVAAIRTDVNGGSGHPRGRALGPHTKGLLQLRLGPGKVTLPDQESGTAEVNFGRSTAAGPEVAERGEATLDLFGERLAALRCR